MGNQNEPLKDIGVEGVKQTGEVLKDIIVHLSGQPTFLFGIAAMLLAIVGVIALAFFPNLPSSLTWFPYALLVFGLMLIGFAYLRMPPNIRSKQPNKTEDKTKPQSGEDTTLQQNPQKVEDTAKTSLGQDVFRPQVMTVKSLTTKLSRLSASQRQILRAISESKGIYAFQLSDKLGIKRDELVYRCKDLERDGLINIESLTDLAYNIPNRYKQLFEKKTIQEILKS